MYLAFFHTFHTFFECGSDAFIALYFRKKIQKNAFNVLTAFRRPAGSLGELAGTVWIGRFVIIIVAYHLGKCKDFGSLYEHFILS